MDKVGTGSAMNGTINATAPKQRAVCSIDDYVNAKRCDIGFNDLKSHVLLRPDV